MSGTAAFQNVANQPRQIARTNDTEQRLFNRSTIDDFNTSDQVDFSHNTANTTSTMLVFAADNENVLDEHGQVSLKKLFNYASNNEQKFTSPNNSKLILIDWPELHDESRVSPANILYGTSSPDKLVEARQSLKMLDAQVMLINQAYGFTTHDSKEEQANGAEIVIDKAVRSGFESLAKMKNSELSEIYSNLDIKNFKSTVFFTEDRSMMMDYRIFESPVWDGEIIYKDGEAELNSEGIPMRDKTGARYSSDPLIAEAFNDNHDTIGKRTRELTKFYGGSINFAKKLEEAINERHDQGIDVSTKASLGMWSHIRPIVANKTNLPNAGILVYQQLNNVELRPVTPLDEAKVAAGLPWAMDNIELPPGAESYFTPDGTRMSIADLRDHHPEYYAHSDHPMPNTINTVFGDILDVGKRQKPQNWDPILRPKNANILVVGGTQSHAKKIRQKLKKQDKDTQVTHLNSLNEINSIEDIETLANHSDAIVFPDMDYTLMKAEEVRAWKSIRELVYAYRLSIEGKGSNPMAGCPIIASTKAAKEFSYHGDFFNKGSSGVNIPDILHTYNGDMAKNAVKLLSDELWDPISYKKHKKRKHFAYEMMTESEICDALKVNNLDELGPKVAILGGATTEEPQTLEETEEFAYQCAKKGMTVFSGGGSNGAMGAMLKGSIRAYNEGHRNFKHVCIRTPIVSAAEGFIKEFFDKEGIECSDGNPDSGYYAYMEDHFHFFEKEAFGARQDAILRFCDYAAVMPGGHGTVYEDLHLNTHAALIDLRGYGLFEGDDAANTTKIEKHINNIKEFFKSYQQNKTSEDKEVYNQYVVENGADMLANIETSITYDNLPRRPVTNISQNTGPEHHIG